MFVERKQDPMSLEGEEWLGVGRGKRKDRQDFNMITEGPSWCHH